ARRSASWRGSITHKKGSRTPAARRSKWTESRHRSPRDTEAARRKPPAIPKEPSAAQTWRADDYSSMTKSPSAPPLDHNPLHADYYADAAIQLRAPVIENVPLARDTYRVRFECREIARRIVPGQFLMTRLADVNDPLLARPLALYDTIRDSAGMPVAI